MTEPPPEAALARPETDETATGATRRRARVIAVAVVVPFVLVIGAVAVFRGGVGGPKKLPIAAAGDAALAGRAEGAFAPYGGVKYVAGPNLPALEGKARAYKVTSTVDADAAKRVASAFGVQGDVTDNGPSFEVVDGSSRVAVYPGVGGQFDYSTGGGSVASSGGVACAPTTGGIEPCVAPTTTISHPAGYPTEGEARTTALTALAAAGVATDGARIEARDDGDRWQIVVTPVVDDTDTQGLQSDVAVNETGITYAHGSLGQVQAVDEYPLIGTAKAIEHLNDGTAFPGFGYTANDEAVVVSSSGGEPTNVASPSQSPPTTVPPDAATCTTFVSPDGSSGETCSGSASVGSAGDPGYACPAIGAVPPETVPPCPPPPTGVPTPPYEPQVVTLTDAKLGLVLAPSGANDAYLLPSYVFSTAEGQGPTALAIDSSWLEPVAPVEPQSGGSEPQTTVIEPQAVPPAPPTTCGPPVESAPPNADPNASTAARPADAVGCPIN